jgi:uncharacterized membrane protein
MVFDKQSLRKSQSTFNLRLPSTRLRFLIIILLVLGVFFRFVHLDRKNYTGDETMTALRISGYTLTEMKPQLLNGRVITLDDLQKYQSPNPEKSVIDTIKGLALEESQVTPLYFVIVRFWVEGFGNSLAVMRSLSAFISLLAFPCLYWLCQELFDSSLIGWITIVLIAISPVHLIYAQDARPYSLLMLTIILSSAALLRAMRVKSKTSWCLYGVTVSLGLYTHLFFGLVATGHGIYVAAMERFQLSRKLAAYLLTSLVGLLTFVPWLLVIILNPASGTVSWTNIKTTFLSSAIRWIGLVSRTFLDLDVSPSDSLSRIIPLIPLILIVLILTIYSIYYISCKTPKKIWLFVLTLIGTTGLALMLPDLILGKRLGTTRYILPCILGIQLSVAYLLVTKITSLSANIQRQKLWKLVAVMLISIGVLSCTIFSQAETWWSNGPVLNKFYSQVANIVNQATQPLLISDSENLISLQNLGHLLEPKVRLQLMAKSNIPKTPDNYSDVFLYNPSESLKSGLERVYKSDIKLILETQQSEMKDYGAYGSFWKLEKRE